MFITTKKHNKILTKEINEVAKLYQNSIDSLRKELEEAKNLKLILEKLYPLNYLDGSILRFNSASGDWKLNLPDTVLQYTEDILGGNVIKQEGTKCIIIDPDGSIKTGLTKQKRDIGFNYKLIRK